MMALFESSGPPLLKSRSSFSQIFAYGRRSGFKTSVKPPVFCCFLFVPALRFPAPGDCVVVWGLETRFRVFVTRVEGFWVFCEGESREGFRFLVESWNEGVFIESFCLGVRRMVRCERENRPGVVSVFRIKTGRVCVYVRMFFLFGVQNGWGLESGFG